jgi:hypothetical protein
MKWCFLLFIIFYSCFFYSQNKKNDVDITFRNNLTSELDKFVSEVEKSDNFSTEESLFFEEKTTNPVNSISLFGKKYNELKDTEIILLKGKQIEYEIDKQKSDDLLLQQKRYWARKRLKFGTPTANNEQSNLVDINEDWNKIKESKTELKKYLKDFIRKQPKIKDIPNSYLKEINPDLIEKKQVENILRLNTLLSKEILGILNPNEYVLNPNLVNDLRKYNVELRTMFAPYGLEKIVNVEHYKALSDLISTNNNLKAKLVELIDNKYNQQKMEEFFRASQILINFASN